jgi:xylan 1,4-beta-xylosidase
MSQSTYYQIDILSDLHEEKHRINESEFYYVIQGKAIISFDRYQKFLKAEDVLFVNVGQMIQAAVGADALLMRIRIPGSRLLLAGGKEFEKVECDSTLGRGVYDGKIRHCARRVLKAWLEPSNELLLSGAEDLLCDSLIRYFSRKDSEDMKHDKGDHADEERAVKIMRYIYTHLDSNMTLTDAAKEMYMSPSTLSRYFHKLTGQYFAQFVKEARLQMAMSDLSQTEHSISQIALDNGFSTPSALSNAFREAVHMSPSEYRRKYAKKPETKQLAAQKAEIRMKLNLQKSAEPESGSISLTIDPAKSEPVKQWENELITGGAAYLLVSAVMEEQLLSLKKLLNYKYLLIWSLFSEPMQIFYGDDRSNPNFAKIDEVLDFCVKHDIKPFLDLSQHLNKSIARGKNSIFDRSVGIVFHSREEWENFFRTFLLHIRRKYGENIVRSWVFEFTFFVIERPYYESDHYSSGEVWNRGVSILHDVIPGAITAGPGMIMENDSELEAGLIDRFLSYGNPPDIFTFNYFLMNSKVTMGIYQRNISSNYPEKEIGFIAQCLQRRNFHGKYYCTEFGLANVNRDYIQDSCYRASFLIWNIFRLWDRIDRIGIFYASDLLDFYADSTDILAGAGGILTRDGIAKPAMYVFEFLKDMGDRLLLKRDDLMITRSEKMIQCLITNYCEIDPEYMETKTMRKPKEISRIFVPGKEKNYHLTIKTSENAKYMVRQKIVNPSNGSVLDLWNEMGNLSEMNSEDIIYLRNICVPKICIRKIPAVNHKIELDITVKPHEIRWISIEKIE